MCADGNNKNLVNKALHSLYRSPDVTKINGSGGLAGLVAGIGDMNGAQQAYIRKPWRGDLGVCGRIILKWVLNSV
jgi:hypothetical protein